MIVDILSASLCLAELQVDFLIEASSGPHSESMCVLPLVYGNRLHSSWLISSASNDVTCAMIP